MQPTLLPSSLVLDERGAPISNVPVYTCTRRTCTGSRSHAYTRTRTRTQRYRETACRLVPRIVTHVARCDESATMRLLDGSRRNKRRPAHRRRAFLFFDRGEPSRRLGVVASTCRSTRLPRSHASWLFNGAERALGGEVPVGIVSIVAKVSIASRFCVDPAIDGATESERESEKYRVRVYRSRASMASKRKRVADAYHVALRQLYLTVARSLDFPFVNKLFAKKQYRRSIPSRRARPSDFSRGRRAVRGRPSRRPAEMPIDYTPTGEIYRRSISSGAFAG